MAERRQYRVKWQRTFEYDDGERCGAYVFQKSRKFGTHKAALKWMVILGPEPWTARGHAPDDPACRCDELRRKQHHEDIPASCERCNYTERGWMEKARADIAPIDWIRLESRSLGPWVEEAVPAPVSMEEAPRG